MKPLYWFLLGILAGGSVILAYLGDPGHFLAFNILFGTAGALFFVFFAKYVLKKFLMREEDYYDS
ncbi:MAG TPA: hypothetical protein VK041_04800 [Opitutales bacterium]|nr:hypothetical protein [Opitutales bacterium]